MAIAAVKGAKKAPDSHHKYVAPLALLSEKPRRGLKRAKDLITKAWPSLGFLRLSEQEGQQGPTFCGGPRKRFAPFALSSLSGFMGTNKLKIACQTRGNRAYPEAG